MVDEALFELVGCHIKIKFVSVLSVVETSAL